MSSTYRAQAIAGRVVVTHDMADATVISEMDVEQADVFLQQFQAALQAAMQGISAPPSFSEMMGRLLPPAGLARGAQEQQG